MYRLSILSFLLLLASCAKVVSPSGGEKDETPPQVLSSIPALYATEVKSGEIEIEFDEYFKLENPGQSVIVSPTLNEKPKFKIKKKSLFIDLGDSLKPNTTYAINFGDALKDYNEGNVLSDFRYVFSTGSFVDSLQVKGNVSDAFESIPEKDVWVMLYDSKVDSLPMTTPPTYIAKTKEDGSFLFTNLPNDSLMVYAVADQNGNYYYDLPNEKFGFYSKTILPKTALDSSKGLELRIFEKAQDPNDAVVSSSKLNSTHTARVQYSQQIASLKVENQEVGKAGKTFFDYSFIPNTDSLQLFFSPALLQGDSLTIIATHEKSDTITFYGLSKDANHQSNYALKTKGWAPNDTVVLTANYPFELTANPPIYIIGVDSNATDTVFPTVRKSWQTSAEILWEQIEDTTYQVVVMPNALLDQRDSLNTDTLMFAYSKNKAAFYGTLLVNIEGAKPNYYATLQKSGSENLKHFPIVEGSIETGALPPGKYILKIGTDESKPNQKWDTGDYEKKLQPEQTFRYKEEIQIRSNWDLELDWELPELTK